MVKRLRVDRSVLWAEPMPAAVDHAANRRRPSALGDDAGPPPDGAAQGRRLRRSGRSSLARLGARIGIDAQGRAADRQHLGAERRRRPERGDRWRKSADSIQEDADVQYADPVTRAYAASRAERSVLPAAVVAARRRWPASTSRPRGRCSRVRRASTVAVVDTGILPHPDLVGRVLPGYDFISDPEPRARRQRPRPESARRRRLERRRVRRRRTTASSTASSSPD